MPKEFIQGVLINEIDDIVERHPYLAFCLIAIGIEFLGKCLLTDEKDWHKIPPKKAFEKGLDLLIKENPKYGELDLRSELRNGFAHTFLPKSTIALSEVRHGAIHFSPLKVPNEKDRTILVVEILFRDFVRACKHVIKKKFPNNDKMKKPFNRVHHDYE